MANHYLLGIDNGNTVTKAALFDLKAREFGADIIKADFKAVFERSYGFLQEGAMGLVYGRNIYQHPNPSRVVRAFMAMIHQNATPEQAWAIYEGE